MMNNNRELAENAQVRLPTSVVRTISLEKLRQPSPLTQHQNNKQTSNQSGAEPQKSKKMYQKILGRKLSGKIEAPQSKQNKILDGKHMISKKFQELRKEVVSKQMKECTFRPQINPNDKQIRNVNQFFKDQSQFNQKKQDKIEEMRILLENTRQKENIFRPNAMLNRQKKSNNGSQPVYERLYQDSKNKEQSQQISRKGSRDTLRTNSITSSKRFRGISRGNSAQKIPKQSQPSISAITSRQLQKQSIPGSNHNISAELSAITTRKGSTQLGKERKESRGRQVSKRVDVNIWEKKDNNKNQEIVIKKLMKEMAIVISKCQLPLVFSYMEMNLFLEKMNFVSSNNTSRKHLFEIWNMLQGEIFQQVSALSIMKIIYAIMGCHNVSLVNRCLEQTWLKQKIASEHQQVLKAQGKQLSFRQNLLMLTQRDSKTLKQCYQELYSNRMKMGESEFLKEEKSAEYSFKPSISKNTAEFAERYRNRMLCETQKLLAEHKISYPVPETGEIDHVDLLMLDQKRKQVILQQKRQEYEQEKRRKQDEALSGGVERESNRSSRNNCKDRNHELFEMGRNVNQTKRDKPADQIEQEKWKNQLTFKPSIKSKKNIIQQLSSKQTYIPDYDKAIYRMQQARRSKDTTPKQQQKDDSPMLYLNVVMEGSQSVKVPVYRGDNMRSITEKVGKMMELGSQEGRGRLEQILKSQILPALEGMEWDGLQVE